MPDERTLEDDMLHPREKWYFKVLTGEVTQHAGPDRMGPYDSKEEAEHALDIAQKRNEEWEAEDNEWNGKKP